MDITGKAIKATVLARASRAALVTKKHSPEILTATGIIGGVAAAVLGARATLKLEATIDQITDGLEIAKHNHETVRLDGRVYTDSDLVKDQAYIYVRGTIDLIKLYGPALSIGAASIACIVGAQGIMQKRNAALVGAYVALEKGFSEYRKRVEGVVGGDAERDLFYGIKRDEITDSEGKKQEIVTFDPNAVSQYAKFFDEYNKNWERNSELNLYWLKAQQTMANDRLHARGHLFLNEVYRQLGLPDTKAGAIVGWAITKDGTGDNFVDFGLFRDTEPVREFVNGHERSILLDFNVNGPIYHLLED